MEQRQKNILILLAVLLVVFVGGAILLSVGCTAPKFEPGMNLMDKNDANLHFKVQEYSFATQKYKGYLNSFGVKLHESEWYDKELIESWFMG